MGGTYPSQEIGQLIALGHIRSEAPIATEQIQPASLDLTISDEAYAVPGSMLPLQGECVRELLERFCRRRIDLSQPQIMVRGEVVWVRLRERLLLPEAVAAYGNSKSSTGRIDLQTRVLCDGNPRYDKVPRGYQGDLWLEMIPKSFDVRLRSGDSLNQMIFFEGREIVSSESLERMHRDTPLLFGPKGTPVEAGQALHGDRDGTHALLMTLDLDQDIVGYVAKKSFRPVDLAQVAKHRPYEFFEPIRRPPDGALFLSREAFYIFSTYEYVAVPTAFAAEMLPYDTSAGEFRAHYAGFFDPGFGYGEHGEVRGTPAVLEVRPYEDDLIVRHRQPVCKMAYEKLWEEPARIYGVGVKSHYAQQRGPRLSKLFATPG